MERGAFINAEWSLTASWVICITKLSRLDIAGQNVVMEYETYDQDYS